MRFILIVNLILPGIGTFMNGRVLTGVFQQIFFWLGIYGIRSEMLLLPGLLSLATAWLWALSGMSVFWEEDDRDR
ncbi:MAG: hypothetical protein AAGK37_06830 [Pseudomonadota bacterium]